MSPYLTIYLISYLPFDLSGGYDYVVVY
jgi:hypothetical protein